MALLECERPKVVRRNSQNSGFKGQNSPDFADVIFVSFNMKLFILKFRDEKGDIVAAATVSHFLHLCNGSWNAVSSPIVWHWPKSMLLYLTSTTLCIHNLSLYHYHYHIIFVILIIIRILWLLLLLLLIATATTIIISSCYLVQAVPVQAVITSLSSGTLTKVRWEDIIEAEVSNKAAWETSKYHRSKRYQLRKPWVKWLEWWSLWFFDETF